jgi:hypothetical protein
MIALTMEANIGTLPLNRPHFFLPNLPLLTVIFVGTSVIFSSCKREAEINMSNTLKAQYLFHNLIFWVAAPVLSKTLIDFLRVLHTKCMQLFHICVATQDSVVRPSTYSTSETTGSISIKFGIGSL